MSAALYSLNGARPATLPGRFVTPDGFVRTMPEQWTPEELAAWGFVEVPETPAFDSATQRIDWQDGGWIVIDLPPPPPPSSDAVNAEASRRISSGFTFEGKLYDYDDKAQKRITGAATLAGFARAAGSAPGDLFWHGGAEPFAWIAADNSLTTMDAPTCFAFGKAAADWESAHVFAGRALKDADPIPDDYADDRHWPEV